VAPGNFPTSHSMTMGDLEKKEFETPTFVVTLYSVVNALAFFRLAVRSEV